MRVDLKLNLKNKRAKLAKAFCDKCNRILPPEKLHQHRKNPRGPYTDENVRILCDECHKTEHRFMERRKFKG